MPEGFNPTLRYTVRRKEAQEILLSHPYPAFWNGRSYRVVVRHVGAGVYEVTAKFDETGGTK